MTTTTTQMHWARVTPDENVGVSVQSRDGQTYVLSLDEPGFASKSTAWVRDFGSQIADLMDALLKWLVVRREKIESANFGIGPSGATFVVIQRATQYAPNFEDELGDLDLQILQDPAYTLVKFRSLALPRCSDDTIRSLMDCSNAWNTSFAGNPREGDGLKDVERQ